MNSRTLQRALALGFLCLAPSACATSPDEFDLLAGQHVIYSYNFTLPVPPRELVDLTRAGLVGGLLMYGIHVNSQTPAAMQELLDAYAESPARELIRKKTGKDTSFLVMTNQEGGTVFNGVKDYGPKEPAKAIGSSPDPSKAGKQAGKEATEGLKAYNFNVNLAPVLGVYREEDNFLDKTNRSYGNSAWQVKHAALPFIKAQRERDMLVSIKHFPGLGAATAEQNTDAAPVTLDVPLSELKHTDIAPFAAAIRCGVDMVMASWAVYPAVDSLPAGLSEKWMKSWLRHKLGFKGVTITEAMEAGSILPYGDIATRAKLAFNAGNDLILASQLNVTEGVEVQQTLAKALRTGEISQHEFDKSTKRIADLRSRTWN